MVNQRIFYNFHNLEKRKNEQEMKNIFSKLQLPDYLSIFRIFAAIALVFLAFQDLRTIFSWLLLIGLFSDSLDGFIARKRNNTTKHGARLDSAGDATIFLGAVIGVLIFEKDFFEKHLLILIISLSTYFIQLGLAYWKYGQPSSFHTYAAKTAAIIQGIFLVYTSFFNPLEWLFFIVIAISILETLEEIILIFIFKKPVYDVKGLYWVLKEGKENFK